MGVSGTFSLCLSGKMNDSQPYTSRDPHLTRLQRSTAHNVLPEIQLPIIIACLSRLSRDLIFAQWMRRTLLCMRILLFSIFTNLDFSAKFAFHRHDPKTYVRPLRVKAAGE